MLKLRAVCERRLRENIEKRLREREFLEFQARKIANGSKITPLRKSRLL